MKKTAKKFFWAVLILCMAMVLAVGCGKSDDPYEKVKYDEYITVPDYSEYTTKNPEVTVTDEDIQTEIDARLAAAATEEKITEGTVEMGDKVEISYHGTLADGTSMDGMNSDSYTLTLGQASMIDGFQESMYGATIGEPVIADLQFPDPYEMNQELSGKAVRFEITVLGKFVDVPAKLNEEFIKTYSDAETIEEYKALVAEELKESMYKSATETLKSEIFEKIYETMEIKDYPQELVQIEKDKMNQQYQYYCDNYGVTWETLLTESLQMTQEEYDEEVVLYAKQVVELKLLAYALADKENIKFPQDEYQEVLDQILASSNYSSAEAFEQGVGITLVDYAESYNYNTYGLRASLILEKALDSIYDKLEKVQ